MKTFVQGIACQTPNEDAKNSLIDYALSKGVPVYDDTRHKHERYNAWPNLTFYYDEICSNSAAPGDPGFTWISEEQFKQYCDNWAVCQPFEIPLTSDYKARIHKDRELVQVGCQRIPFAKVKEVYDACFNS